MSRSLRKKHIPSMSDKCGIGMLCQVGANVAFVRERAFIRIIVPEARQLTAMGKVLELQLVD
jgi:hypothetical protein